MDALLFGIGVGLALGLTGAGGGILAIPALILGLDFSPSEAIPIALVAVAMSASIGCVDGLKKGIVRYKAALLMAALGITLSPVGIWLSSVLPVPLLMLMFSSVMIYVSARMGWQALFTTSADHLQNTNTATKPCVVNQKTGRFQWNTPCFKRLSLLGGCSGLLSGMLGVGGGFLIVPGMSYFSDLKMHGTVATSLAVIAIITSFTAFFGLATGIYQPLNEWGFIASSLLGMLAGRALIPHIEARKLTLIFAFFALSVACLLIVKTLS